MRRASTARTPQTYIASLEEPRKSEVAALHKLICRTLPRLKPYMHDGIIGYGKYHYQYASGREGDWFHIGLTSGKTGISVYVVAVDDNGYLAEQAKASLGKAIVGKSCIRFKRLEDIHLPALKRLLVRAAKTGPMSQAD